MALSNSDPIEFKIKQAKVRLLFGQPFFGTLIMNLPLVDATNSGWCPTAAVDGRNIYYNKEFFKDLKVDEIQFVLCHEVLHVALDSFGRRSHRDPGWWNMAHDYIINALLIKERIGTMPTKTVEVAETNEDGVKSQVQRVGLYDVKYTEPNLWTAEAVYDDLAKRKVKKQLTLDVHLELGKDGNQKSNTRRGIPIEISDEDLKKLRTELKAKVLDAASAAAGKMPASLQRIVDDLVESKVNWRDLLKQSIQSCIVDDFTWSRPNRRHMYSGVFLPSLKKDETIDIEIAIDMSGSITQDMARSFMSEIHGIMDMYADFNIGLLTFDTNIYNHKTFTKDTMDEFMRYKPVGGGGTDFECFWNHWKHEQIEPKLAVIFTDGYPCGSWGPHDYCNTLWIITDGAKTRVKPPFGSYAYFDSTIGIEEIGSV